MANVKINQGGVKSLIRSAAVKSATKNSADKICAKANSLASFHSDFDADPYGSWVNDAGIGHVATRAIGRDGAAAINECKKHNTLKKAVGA